jgi:hypothetical protein
VNTIMTDETSTRSDDLAQDADLQRNPVKDPEEWTTGDEPMTGPQASYLRTLLQEAGKSADDLNESTTKAQASKMIDELQQVTGRGAGPEQ